MAGLLDMLPNYGVGLLSGQMPAPEPPPIFLATPDQPPGLLQLGNINLMNRPNVINPDGTASSVRSMSANFDGREVLIPTVSDEGQIMSDEDAVKYYQKTGRHLGMFDTPENATAYAKMLHDQQAAMGRKK